ncbi:alpha/beta hydrolase [Rubritepida flocculans]|jgi:triacylglycerol lipase|uniref:alpha/beta hydrolase n=1 Tax=Rubritepida flocculans TaxID=182403 RepID=UPI000425FDDD|nr:alpha/beta hydrolase fold domain-containing protein [Rubritepida flocculans]
MMGRLLALAVLAATPAHAQFSALPEEARAAIARIGPAMGPEAVAATGAALAPVIPAPGVAALRDLRYGEDPRHRLDVFTPGAGARPVLVFVHGGGFVGGDKTRPGVHYYDNIAAWAARQGWVGVNITYRLAPQHPFPAAREDVAAAIAWLRAHIAAHGGDPARIILMGQSAGAAHVADYLASRAEAPGVAAGALVSGVYDVARYPRAATTRAYYGEDEALLAARSALPGLARLSIPLLIARAGSEPEPFRAQAALLSDALCAARTPCPAILELDGHNHFSTVFAIGSADRALTDALLGLLPR